MTDPHRQALGNAVAVITAAFVEEDETLARSFLQDLDIYETRDVVLAIAAVSGGAVDRLLDEQVGMEPAGFWSSYLQGLGIRGTEG